MQRHRDRRELGVVKTHVDQCPARSHEVQPWVDMLSGVLSARKTSMYLSFYNNPGSHALYVKIKFCLLQVLPVPYDFT